MSLEEVICVQLGLEWLRLSTRWFRRKYSLLTQTTMLIEVNSDVKGIKRLYCRYLIEVN